MTAADATRGMSAAEIETMRSVEDESWWYRALREHVLNSIAPLAHDFELLDAGCDSGGMLARVRSVFPMRSLQGSIGANVRWN